MAQNGNRIALELPERLRRQFAEVSRRLWLRETAAALCAAGGSLVLSYLALFVADRYGDTPVGWRLAIAGAGAVGALGAAGWWARGWGRHRRDQRALALHVQQHYRRLGDRLLGVVELADESSRPAYFSPALYRAAIDQVATEAATFDFRQTVNLRAARYGGLALLGLLALGALPVLLLPTAGWNAFRRWISPTAAIARYTLVGLEAVPTRQVVPHGEPFDLECAVRYRSAWRPTRAFCRYEDQNWIEAAVQGGRVRFHVPGQTQRGALRIQVGDARRQVLILPTYRPALRELSATIDLPKYLGYSPVEVAVQNGLLPVLEGSRVTFQGKATRALAAATLQAGTEQPQPLPVQADTFASPALDLDAVRTCVFTWRDRLGLETGTPWRLSIEQRKDAPPEPQLPDLQPETALLVTDVLEVKAVARDDFGVRDLGLTWQRAADSPSTNRAAIQTFRVPAESHQQRELQETFRFSPALMNVPPDSTIELQAFARDFFPGRPPVTTPVYRVYVLGNAQHAEMVRANLESLMSHLEEITRLEEKIANDTRQMTNRAQPTPDDTPGRLDKTADDQTFNATALDQLTKQGAKWLWEALKNPTFPADTLRDWTQKFRDLHDLAGGPMPRAASQLKSAGQNASGRPDKLAQALQTEEQILAALAQAQQKVNQSLDQLQALTLAQRLRQVAGTEQDLATQLKQIVPETVGLFPKELPDRLQHQQTSLAGDQDNAQKESQTLQGEISRFFERTQRQSYGEVGRAMKESHATDELDRVRGLIQENISMDAMQNLTQWSARFKEWADKLQPPKPPGPNGGSQGGGGNSGENDALQQLLALLRLREGETQLRQETGLVERQKADPSAYPDKARVLSATQQKLGEALRSIQAGNRIAELNPVLQDGQNAMHQVQSLLDKPQTDQTTDRAQVRTIDLLSDAINLINEQAQRQNGQAGGGSADIAFLWQMMALRNSLNPNPGRFGGGNPGHGDGQVPPSALSDPTGKRGETRSVRKASGTTAPMPAEFRDALENYFHGLEQPTP